MIGKMEHKKHEQAHTVCTKCSDEVMIVKNVLLLPLRYYRASSNGRRVKKKGCWRLIHAFNTKKVELLSSWLGKGETIISMFYLQWIHRFPKTYSVLYVVRGKILFTV